MYIFIYTYIYISYIYIYICICVHNIYVYEYEIHTSFNFEIHTSLKHTSLVLIHIYICTHIHTCMWYIYIYICVYVCIYMYIYEHAIHTSLNYEIHTSSKHTCLTHTQKCLLHFRYALLIVRVITTHWHMSTLLNYTRVLWLRAFHLFGWLRY